MLKSTKAAAKTSTLLGRLFGWLPIDPNAITLVSVLFALFGFLSFGNQLEDKAISLSFFLLAFAFDALDGAVARAQNKVTKQGAFIDGIADRIVEFFLLLTLLELFAFNVPILFVLFSILFFGTCMTAFVKAYADHRGLLASGKAATLPGLLERAERSILLLLAFILLIADYLQYGMYVLYLTAILSLMTFLQRVYLVLYKKISP